METRQDPGKETKKHQEAARGNERKPEETRTQQNKDMGADKTQMKTIRKMNQKGSKTRTKPSMETDCQNPTESIEKKEKVNKKRDKEYKKN